MVQDVMQKLNRMDVRDSKGLVGIDHQMECVKSLLRIGEEGVRFIGIWGMGVMGKTTLAEAVYNEVHDQFQGHCFLGNVRERSSDKSSGIESLRDQLLSEILEEKNLHIGTPSVGSTVIQDRLRQKKVLVVLDDVNDSKLLETLVSCRDHFGSGSRIILTSREKQVLLTEVDGIHEIQGLNYGDSLQLFCQNAFKQNVPPIDFKHLSNSILDYIRGVPLALKVLGKALHKKGADYWQCQLNKLKVVPNKAIDTSLRISFEGLDDDQKNIFLDIACFFKGFDKEDVINLLDDCAARCGIEDLKDKALLTSTNENILWMHDMIQVMGKNIVREEPIQKRRRVWDSEDGHKVLKHQRHYPLESFPTNFMPDYLVELRLPCSNVKQIWEGIKDLKNLRVINVSMCKNLTKIPNLSGAKGLRSLIVHGCESLVELPPLSHLESLEPHLDVDSCINLEKFPDFPLHLKSLSLGDTAIQEVPESIKFLQQLKYLNLSRSMIKTLPDGIVEMKSLGKLGLWHCSNLVEFPKQLPSTLYSLGLTGCKRLEYLPLSALPSRLKELNAADCPSLNDVLGAQPYQYAPEKDPIVQHTVGHIMDFFNCFNLGQNAVQNIVANALLKIHCIANHSVAKCEHFGYFHATVASDEISKRFKYQSTNSAINAVKLNPDGQGVRFVGFVPCVVIDFDKQQGPIYFIDCIFKLKSKGGNFERSTFFQFRDCVPNHVFIWFDDATLIEDKDYEEASFEFSVKSKKVKVKKCGVHIFYADGERIILNSGGESSDAVEL